MLRPRWRRELRCACNALVSSVCVMLTAVPAAADPVAEFYKGKTLSLIAGFPPGGGYDTYVRVLARHYGHYEPGQVFAEPVDVVIGSVGHDRLDRQIGPVRELPSEQASDERDVGLDLVGVHLHPGHRLICSTGGALD